MGSVNCSDTNPGNRTQSSCYAGNVAQPVNMYYGSYVLYFFLILLILYLLRFMYLRYRINAQIRQAENRSENSTFAPYFIRLRTMAAERVEQNAVIEAARNELHPKYDDIVDAPTYKNLAYSEEPPPDYSYCIQNEKKDEDEKQNRY